MPQPIPNATTANIAILRHLLDRAIKRMSLIDVPGILRNLTIVPRLRYNSAMAANPRRLLESRNRG
jgi:hypothetical protein